mgnify:CR=1 FL=1
MKVRPYFANLEEFKKILIQDPIFPNKTLNEIYMIPQYKLTSDSYQMYEYMNITQYVEEGDYLSKFLELESFTEMKKDRHTGGGNIYPGLSNGTNFYNVTIEINSTLENIFKVLDQDLDGYINFFEYGTFMQIGYTFTHHDEYGKGVNTAGELYEIFRNYADYPSITYKIREKAERFNMLDPNINIDLLSTIQMFRIDDLVKYFLRKTDMYHLYEIDLKKLLMLFNMRYVPETYLNRCLRGIDYEKGVPKYDWECSFLEGMKANLKYYENMNNYKEIKMNNLTTLNTVFYNIDPKYA